MDTPNSQKKSSSSSKKSKRQAVGPDWTAEPRRPEYVDEEDRYLDRSFDLVARVKAAKEAAQRKMEEFGDPSEYDVTYIYGQWKPETALIGDDPQASLPFKEESAKEEDGE